MLQFLSDEWIAALADACRGANVARGGGAERLVVEPAVHDVPDRGEVRYRVLFDETSCTVERPCLDAPTADVRLETDYVTAVALARGETNAQAALADGRLRISGDVTRLAAHASVLSRLADLFVAVRTTTTYLEPPERGA
ncbi:MAG: SCP2 sterol-binding domain-containing protein [Acidimicrobiia bacterium]